MKPMLRRCRDCGLEAPVAEFPRARGRKDQRSTRCSGCRTRWRARGRRRKTGRRWRVIQDGMLRCNSCKRDLPATPEHFARHRKCLAGLSTWCLECHRIRQREFYRRRMAGRICSVCGASTKGKRFCEEHRPRFEREEAA
jgi:hypothetical protein